MVRKGHRACALPHIWWGGTCHTHTHTTTRTHTTTHTPVHTYLHTHNHAHNHTHNYTHTTTHTQPRTHTELSAHTVTAALCSDNYPVTPAAGRNPREHRLPPQPMKAGGKAHPSGEPAEPLPPHPLSLYPQAPWSTVGNAEPGCRHQVWSLAPPLCRVRRLQTPHLLPVRSSGRRLYRSDRLQAGKIGMFPGAPSWKGDGISKEKPAPL